MPSDFYEYHHALCYELACIKDKIRHLVQHNATDGAFKEAALRTVLRRHLPDTMKVCQGFVVTTDDQSTQVDILIIDSNKPTLFRDGDLVIVTPDVVKAIIEVKTELDHPQECDTEIHKLAKIGQLCSEHSEGHSFWTGMFIYRPEQSIYSERSQENLLRAVGRAHLSTGCCVNCISHGIRGFIRYWKEDAVLFEQSDSRRLGARWHSYDLESLAPSYFIGNLIHHLSSIDGTENSRVWFPMDNGKECKRRFFLRRGETEPIRFQQST